MKIKVKKLHAVIPLPVYQSKGAAGFDLAACESKIIMPGETALVGTGLSFEIPEGYEMQVRPRSGLSAKTKLRVANSPGTIDSDYRGEIKIIVDNQGTLPYEIKYGERIAQAVICPVIQVELEEVVELETTERGANGFGSSGV
jgi:dUTP pyrophosphatase